MHQATTLPDPQRTCSRGDCATLFVSLELSRSTWLATALVPGSSKMSKYTLVGGDGHKLLELLAQLKSRAEQRIAAPVKIVTIHEVGLDGFWIHRLLEANGVESHVVDPASIAVPRRHRRAKTDTIDGETLLRTLMAWQRGEPRVCAMTVPPSPSEEDCRSCCRSALGTRTAFADCCSARGSPTTIRCTRTAGKTWNNCGPGTDAQCQLTSSQRFFARSIGSSWSYAKSARSKLNAMKCCRWRNRALPPHSLCGSRALARNSLACSTLRVCSAGLTTDGSWRPMPA